MAKKNTHTVTMTPRVLRALDQLEELKKAIRIAEDEKKGKYPGSEHSESCSWRFGINAKCDCLVENRISSE